MNGIHCIFCEKKYQISEANTKIYGPYMEVICPWCFRVFRGKLLNFVDILANTPRYSLEGAALMQRMSQYIEKNVVQDAAKGRPGREKKKPKKDKKDKKKK